MADCGSIEVPTKSAISCAAASGGGDKGGKVSGVQATDGKLHKTQVIRQFQRTEFGQQPLGFVGGSADKYPLTGLEILFEAHQRFASITPFPNWGVGQQLI